MESPLQFRRIIPLAEEDNQADVTRLRGMISSARTVSVEEMDGAIRDRTEHEYSGESSW